MQYEEASAILAEEGRLKEAVDLLLKGRVPAKAAAVICRALPPAQLQCSGTLERQSPGSETDAREELAAAGPFPSVLLEGVVEELLKIELTERAADVLAHLGKWKKALLFYK